MLEPIAVIHTNLEGKFGVPRQGGVMPKLRGCITFLPKYAVPEAVCGLEGFSHIWLLWDFSQSHGNDGESAKWSPTVRPPRLGGNKRMGVFATRSPFRPNNIGMSAVKLEKIDFPDIYVSGVDLMDGTPIYDIKPYIPYSDSIPDAVSGFVGSLSDLALKVQFPDDLMDKLHGGLPDRLHGGDVISTKEDIEAVREQIKDEITDILSHDMRPQYQNDPKRVYGITYLGRNIRFSIDGDVLTVLTVE